MKDITSYNGNFNYSIGGNTTGKKNIKSLVSSLKHSLRLVRELDQKIIKNNSALNYHKDQINQNLYFVDNEKLEINFENSEEAQKLLTTILEDIEINIDLTKSANKKEILKKKHNLTGKLKEKYGDDIIEFLELNKNKEADKIYNYLLEKHNITKPKIFKPAIQQIKNYLEILKDPPKKEYRNETLIKEIIFKIPDNNELKNLDSTTLKAIHDKICKRMYKGHRIAVNAIHNDEDNNHIHTFIHGYNDITGNFDILKTEHNFLVAEYYDQMIKSMEKILKDPENKIKTQIEIPKLTPKNILKYKQDPLILKVLGEYKQKAFRDLANEILIDKQIYVNKKVYPSKEEELKFRKLFEEDKILKEKGLSPFRREVKEQKVKNHILKQEEQILQNKVNSLKSAIQTIEDANDFINNIKTKNRGKIDIPENIDKTIIKENIEKSVEILKEEKDKVKSKYDEERRTEDKEKLANELDKLDKTYRKAIKIDI